jgi:cysteinyl-tRNA synthetase
MEIYNTMTHQKEEFVPLVPGEARIYACGPTVYNFIHIGNARPLIIFDTLRRYLEYRGYRVLFAQNFTDVDDKIIARANIEKIPASEVAEKYIAEYKTDAEGLGVRPATFHPRATENIGEIIEFITKLIDGGHAYVSAGSGIAGASDVYFRVRSFADYGKLSNQPLDDLEAGARVDVSDIKEDPMDFALWKAAKPGEPSWQSPWGEGRPGWHIECSAMSCRYLGKTIDIHAGGQDLIFPHHENEIAQSECANGVKFARYWMHNGYINIDNRKMSKSAGNFFTVREISEKYGYMPIRMLMLSAQYRSPINFSDDILTQMQAGLERLRNCRENLDYLLAGSLPEENPGDDAMIKAYDIRRDQFIAAMDDDLNTADAVSAIYELARDINAAVSGGTPSRKLVKGSEAIFDELCGVLGLPGDAGKKSVDAEIEALIEKRTKARAARDFAAADAIRDELRNRGIQLEDGPQGVKWSYIG